MPRYIDADDFERRLEHPPYTIYNGQMFVEWYDECMESQPPANVQEVKHGRWIPNKHTDTVLCSQCGKCYGDEHRYCPDCGAKMEGVK